MSTRAKKWDSTIMAGVALAGLSVTIAGSLAEGDSEEDPKPIPSGLGGNGMSCRVAMSSACAFFVVCLSVFT